MCASSKDSMSLEEPVPLSSYCDGKIAGPSDSHIRATSSNLASIGDKDGITVLFLMTCFSLIQRPKIFTEPNKRYKSISNENHGVFFFIQQSEHFIFYLIFQ